MAYRTSRIGSLFAYAILMSHIRGLAVYNLREVLNRRTLSAWEMTSSPCIALSAHVGCWSIIVNIIYTAAQKLINFFELQWVRNRPSPLRKRWGNNAWKCYILHNSTTVPYSPIMPVWIAVDACACRCQESNFRWPIPVMGWCHNDPSYNDAVQYKDANKNKGRDDCPLPFKRLWEKVIH